MAGAGWLGCARAVPRRLAQAYGRGFNPRLQPMALWADAVPHENELLPYPGLEQKHAAPWRVGRRGVAGNRSRGAAPIRPRPLHAHCCSLTTE